MPKELTVKEIARKGGQATLKKYGKDYYKKIVAKRWNKKGDKKAKQK